MKIDPTTTEIIRATFNAVAERMRIAMIKTAYNIVISESLDFGVAIFDRDVNMIAQGTGIPLFQGHLGFPIEATIAARGIDDFRPGDVLLHNDPYDGNGNHLNDVAVFAPVFWGGRLVGWVAVKAHWMDIGGAVPSSILTDSTDFRQEGLRFQALKLQSQGVLNDEVLRLVTSNIRPEAGSLKDLTAMMAVCRVGENYFKEVLGKYGVDTALEATRIFMEQSEKRTRAALRDIPAGTYTGVGYFDNDGIDLDTPVKVEVKVTIADGAMTVDCTGTDKQIAGPFNCGSAITVSACRLLIKCLTAPTGPVDEGCFRPLTVIVPSGTVLSCEEPAPTARYYTPINLLLELVLRALGEAMPERIPAGSFADQMPMFLFGRNPDTGRLFVQGEASAGGAGGRPARDADSALAPFGGNTLKNNPVEVVETRNRFIRIMKYGLREDSGGAGKYRGGLGIERVYHFDIPASGIFTLERKATPPWGLHGGGPGAVNEIVIKDKDGKTRSLRKVTGHPIEAGEIMYMRTGGGGGYGDPKERDREAVRRDVEEGYVSAEAAKRLYG